MAYNVLVVDDSRVARRMIIKILGMTDIDLGEVHEAENGIEALEKLEHCWIDLVLADINMPEMNGVELVEAMEKRGILESTPVAIISTERSETRIRELKARGVRAYMNKPFTPERVKAMIEAVAAGRTPINEEGDFL